MPALFIQNWELSSRITELENAELNGAKAVLHTKDLGDIEATAWIANFKTPFFTGLGLLENIASIIALEKLSSQRKRVIEKIN